jgi:hypothetical protein
MDLSQGVGDAAAVKSRLELERIHSIDENYVALICSRPNGDKWKSLLRNERGPFNSAIFSRWMGLLGPACEHVWRVQSLPATQPREMETQLRKLFIDRDIQAGITYDAAQRREWRFAGTKWVSMEAAVDFESVFKDDQPYPSTKNRPRVNGVTLGSGVWETRGYVGDYALLRSWALTLFDIAGTPSLITLVDLREGEYLGSVSGVLHFAMQYNQAHWVEDQVDPR